MFCMKCGYGGESAEACPRCGAGEAYLLDIPALAQGPAYLPNELELGRDNTGFTHPNLHRRTAEDPQTDTYPDLCIYGTNAYRYMNTSEHDEESTTSEIP